MFKPKVAVSRSYFESYSELPKRIQKKSREFCDKFLENPKSIRVRSN